MIFLLIAFIVIPLVELSVIGEVQNALGWPTTILILVLDSLVGAYLVRLQGARAWHRFQTAAGSGKMPAEEVIDGALILFGGALMLTPGFVTDGVGLACVITPSRRLLNALIRRRVSPERLIFGSAGGQGGGGPFGNAFIFRAGGQRPGPGPSTGDSTPIDGAAGQDRAGRRPPSDRPRPRPGVIDVEVVEVTRNDAPGPRDRGSAPGGSGATDDGSA